MVADDFDGACVKMDKEIFAIEIKNSKNMEEITQPPALLKDNLSHKENCPNQQIRREGHGRIST